MKRELFITVYIFFILIALSLNCIFDPQNNTNNDKTSHTYPTTIYPLSNEELSTLRAEFDSLKGNIKAYLNNYGFIDYAGSLSRGSSNIQDARLAIQKSKSTLLQLSKFTNVSDSSQLVIKETTNQHGTSLFNDWIVIFENQKFQGLEIMDTEIMVLLGDEVKQISGHHYQEIHIPAKDEIDNNSIKDILIGYQIHFICWAETTFEITEESIFIDQIEKVIYPIKNADSIEFRVAWKVVIGKSPNHPDWNAFVDVISGEIIDMQQLFVC